MDNRVDADNEWYISPLIDLKAFLEEGLHANTNLRDFLLPAESVLKNNSDENHADILIDQLSNLCGGLSTNVSRKIVEQDLDLKRLVVESTDMEAILPKVQISGRITPENDATKRTWEFDLHDFNLYSRPELLQTHVYAAQNVEICTKNPQKKSNYLRTMMYDKYDHNEIGLEKEMPHRNSPCEKDVVIMVTAMVPKNKMLTSQDIRGSRVLAPLMKFMLRGESTLMSLKRKLSCVCDMTVPLEDGRELETPEMAKSHGILFPSSFIYINDTFYVDSTAANAIDISEPIREFIERKNCFGPVKKMNIESVKIIDLQLRLGMPYVYHHSGTCEHLLIFHDLRLMHSSDVQEISRYPLLGYEKGGDARCEACKQNFATYQVEDCERLPFRKMLFCDICFKEFHFNHGEKIGKFTAHPYFQINRLSLWSC